MDRPCGFVVLMSAYAAWNALDAADKEKLKEVKRQIDSFSEGPIALRDRPALSMQ